MKADKNGALIYQWLRDNGPATRDEITQALHLSVNGARSALRRLKLDKHVVNTGEFKESTGCKPFTLVGIGPTPLEIEEVGDDEPTVEEPSLYSNLVRESLDYFEQVLRGWVNENGNAQCEANVHPGRGDGNRGLGLGQCGPEDSSAGERLCRDEGFIPGGAEALPRRR